MLEKLKATLHELAESKKALVFLFSVLTALLTNLGGLLFAHFGPKIGLAPDLALAIPKGAAYLSAALIGLAMTYLHSQAKVDVAEANAGAPGEWKIALQGLALEAVKAALDQHLPQAIAASIQSQKPAQTEATRANASPGLTVSIVNPQDLPPKI